MLKTLFICSNGILFIVNLIIKLLKSILFQHVPWININYSWLITNSNWCQIWIRISKIKSRNCFYLYNLKLILGHIILIQFKRSAGPKNRRAPSCYSQNVSDSRKPEILPAVERSSERPDRNRDSLLEVDRKVKRPKIAFLELHHADSNRETNASKISPPVSKVSSIPNLDLTILHEHGDGNGEYFGFDSWQPLAKFNFIYFIYS